MKIYYILSILSDEEKKFFLDSISNITKLDDIDYIIKTKYYRVNRKTENTTYNSIILETWLFIKEIWIKYWISPTEISWVYKENMVILKDDLWIFRNNVNEWVKISWEENIYFFTSRYSFWNVFWAFWDELSKINKKFPKLVYPNKDLDFNRHEKSRYIMKSYSKRKEIIGNFMLPLMYTRNIQSIKNLLILWKNVTWEKEILLKKSWATDNWKHITLFNADEYLLSDQKLDYLFLKYISSISEFDPWIYFTSYYNINKEFRLYYIKDKNTWKYKLCSAKQKINLTSKDELFLKTTLSTWNDMKVKWELLDIDLTPKKLEKLAKFVLKRNNIEVWVIEFVELPSWEYRFLEINCLWWSMMFEWKDEENIKNMISDWWKYLFKKNVEPK